MSAWCRCHVGMMSVSCRYDRRYRHRNFEIFRQNRQGLERTGGNMVPKGNLISCDEAIGCISLIRNTWQSRNLSPLPALETGSHCRQQPIPPPPPTSSSEPSAADTVSDGDNAPAAESVVFQETTDCRHLPSFYEHGHCTL